MIEGFTVTHLLLSNMTTDLLVFHMSATMARQGGRVQLKQADMRIGPNMVHMAKHSILCSGIEETTHLIKKQRAEI
jgi:hypothetical protein